jgi:hypothetical protein
MTAPQIRPHTPYFTFPAVTGFIDHPSLLACTLNKATVVLTITHSHANTPC